MFRRRDEIEKKLDEICKFLNNVRHDFTEIARCSKSSHKGLTFKCIYGGKDCVTCLACEVEEIIENWGDRV